MTDAQRTAAIAAEVAAALAAARRRSTTSAAGRIEPISAGGISPGAAGFEELQHQMISVATAATHTIIQGAPGARIDVYELALWNVTEQNLEWYDGSDSLDGPFNSFPDQSGLHFPNVGEYRFRLAPGNSFKLKLSAATQVSGHVLYRVTME